MGSTIHPESGKSRRVYGWNPEDERSKKKINPFKATNKNELQHKIALSLYNVDESAIDVNSFEEWYHLIEDKKAPGGYKVVTAEDWLEFEDNDPYEDTGWWPSWNED